MGLVNNEGGELRLGERLNRSPSRCQRYPRAPTRGRRGFLVAALAGYYGDGANRPGQRHRQSGLFCYTLRAIVMRELF